MTKTEKKVMQNHFNLLSEISAEKNEVFEELQRRNKEEGSGNAWCCANRNFKDLLANGKDYSFLYDKYVECCAKEDLLREFGGKLAGLGFWKNK